MPRKQIHRSGIRSRFPDGPRLVLRFADCAVHAWEAREIDGAFAQAIGEAARLGARRLKRKN